LTINEFARDALLKGELEVYGPQFWRPYCHVSDIAQAVALVLEAQRETISKRTLNVGCNEENYQKRMIADEIKRQIPVKIIDVEKDEDPRDYRVSFDRIAALGFSPQLRLSDGIREISRAISSGLISDPYSGKYRNS
jgi:nucleoside-diphosphate-sugar epimerase